MRKFQNFILIFLACTLGHAAEFESSDRQVAVWYNPLTEWHNPYQEQQDAYNSLVRQTHIKSGCELQSMCADERHLLCFSITVFLVHSILKNLTSIVNVTPRISDSIDGANAQAYNVRFNDVLLATIATAPIFFKKKKKEENVRVDRKYTRKDQQKFPLTCSKPYGLYKKNHTPILQPRKKR